jgi:hypothetical protein
MRIDEKDPRTEPTRHMKLVPIVRMSSVAGAALVRISLVVSCAGGGCSLNMAGISDPGSGESSRGGAGGGTTAVQTADASTADTIVIGPGGGGNDGGGAGGSLLAGAGGAAGSGGPGGDSIGGTTGTTNLGGTTGATSTGGATGTGGAAGNGATGVGGAVGAGLGGAAGTGAGGNLGMGGMPGPGMGTGGTAGSPPAVVGCADGTREAFIDLRAFPSIAGCAGGWSIAGLVGALAPTIPACARAGGNNGTKPDGTGCNVEDLCAAGWHVCRGANEVDGLGVTCAQAGIPAATNNVASRVLYATRQRGLTGTTCNAADLIGLNDVHGCGNFGLAEDPNCSPLDRQFSHTECDEVPPWACDDPNSAVDEGQVVTKPGAAGGGVLCCH